MRNADYRSGEALEHGTNLRPGKRRKIAGRLVEDEHIIVAKGKLRKENFCFLPTGKLRNGVFRFCRGKAHTAKIGTHFRAFLAAAAAAQKLHRSFCLRQQIRIILRHIRRAYILSRQQLRRYKAEQCCFTRTVLPGYADMLAAVHLELNIFCENPVACFEHRQRKTEHGFAGGQGGAFSKLKKNGIPLLRKVCKLFLFLLKAPPNGLYRVHLFLQQRAAVRVAAANGTLLVLNLVADAAETLHFLIKFPTVALCNLLLAFKKLRTAAHILGVRKPEHRRPRHGLFAELLHVDYGGGCIFK